MRHFYLLAPILSIIVLLGAFFMIRNSASRPIPRYDPGNYDEDSWSPEEYLRTRNVRVFDGREVHRLLIKRTRQKQGVYLESLDPRLDSAGLEVVNVFHNVMGDDYVPVITSGNDWPYHAKNSKHYQNKALDFRIKFIPMEKRRMVVIGAEDKLKGRCRVLWEKGEAEHLHVELLD